MGLRIFRGDKLKNHVASVRGWKKRSKIGEIEAYLSRGGEDVCILSGVLRTGKTSMLRQALAAMEEETIERSALIIASAQDTMYDIDVALENLRDKGVKFVFIDEITKVEDFINGCSFLANDYATDGMKIVLAGTNSLGFYFAAEDELYNKCDVIPVTYITYTEYKEIMGISNLDEFIEYGGIFHDLQKIKSAKESVFADFIHSSEFVHSALAMNIQNAMRLNKHGYFRNLFNLYESRSLLSAIQRIVQDDHHRIVLDTIVDEFKSAALGSLNDLLNKPSRGNKRLRLYDFVDREKATKDLMARLDIINPDPAADPPAVTALQAQEIGQYLRLIGVMRSFPYIREENDTSEHRNLCVLPGLRWSQMLAFIDVISDQANLKKAFGDKLPEIIEKAKSDAKGRILEEIILLETSENAPSEFRVFYYEFASGEIDMVIQNKKDKLYSIYEIKYNYNMVKEQAKHLVDPKKIEELEGRFGSLVEAGVIYMGQPAISEYGVSYFNADQFIADLPSYWERLKIEDDTAPKP